MHAPLQLASVLLAAASTTEVCNAVLGESISMACMSLISLMQLSLGLAVPGAILFALDSRTTRTFMPHVQARRWLVHP